MTNIPLQSSEAQSSQPKSSFIDKISTSTKNLISSALDDSFDAISKGAKEIARGTRKFVTGAMATAQSLVPSATTTGVVGTAAAATTLESCQLFQKGNDPTPIDIPLTPEQQSFLNLLNPANPDLIARNLVQPSIKTGRPIVCVPLKPSLYVDPNSSPEEQKVIEMINQELPNLISLELQVGDPRTMTYVATPVINRSAAEKLIKIAELQNPSQLKHAISCAARILSNANQSLFPGFEIGNIEDNDPTTPAPYVMYLPEKFTLSTMNQYYGSGYRDSYEVTNANALNFNMSIGKYGTNMVNYTISPIQTVKNGY